MYMFDDIKIPPIIKFFIVFSILLTWITISFLLLNAIVMHISEDIFKAEYTPTYAIPLWIILNALSIGITMAWDIYD